MKNFQFHSTVYVFHRGAAYAAEYRGQDSFEHKRRHVAYITKMGMEVNKQDNEIFHTMRELKKAHPGVYLF